MYSKCGVPPRMMTPSATTASAPASSAALQASGQLETARNAHLAHLGSGGVEHPPRAGQQAVRDLGRASGPATIVTFSPVPSVVGGRGAAAAHSACSVVVSADRLVRGCRATMKSWPIRSRFVARYCSL